MEAQKTIVMLFGYFLIFLFCFMTRIKDDCKDLKEKNKRLESRIRDLELGRK